MRYHSSCTAGKAAIARGDELAMQANRFYPTDPFTSTDPNPNYDSRYSCSTCCAVGRGHASWRARSAARGGLCSSTGDPCAPSTGTP